MSVPGQNAKYSERADVFCFAPATDNHRARSISSMKHLIDEHSDNDPERHPGKK
jgi:hypothetical protein